MGLTPAFLTPESDFAEWNGVPLSLYRRWPRRPRALRNRHGPSRLPSGAWRLLGPQSWPWPLAQRREGGRQSWRWKAELLSGHPGNETEQQSA